MIGMITITGIYVTKHVFILRTKKNCILFGGKISFSWKFLLFRDKIYSFGDKSSFKYVFLFRSKIYFIQYWNIFFLCKISFISNGKYFSQVYLLSLSWILTSLPRELVWRHKLKISTMCNSQAALLILTKNACTIVVFL